MSVYAKESPEYLVEALHSMLAQTVPPEQIVLVEDGQYLDVSYTENWFIAGDFAILAKTVLVVFRSIGSC